jgi:hypothetical protein
VRRSAAIVILVVLAISLTDAQPAAVVTFVKQGVTIPLSVGQQAEIAARVQSLIVGCGMNSVSYPNLFSERVFEREWQQIRAGSHLYVSFPARLRTTRGAVPISEVVIGFDDPGFIGPELSRDGDVVVGHVKCDGYRALAIMCAPALRPHLLPGQQTNCGVYDRIGDPK